MIFRIAQFGFAILYLVHHSLTHPSYPHLVQMLSPIIVALSKAITLQNPKNALSVHL